METNIKDFIVIFTSILYEALPFIVFGAIIAGIVEEVMSPQFIARLIPRNRILAIALSGFLGLPSPMCDCGILVIVRRLLRKGVPLSCCVCYLLAGPIINVVTMLSTRVAFANVDQINASGRPTYQFDGNQMMILRVALGFLVAFVTGLIVEWQYRKHGAAKLLVPLALPVDPGTSAKEDAEADALRQKRKLSKRLQNIVETALHDFVDVMVFVILGALLAALGRLLLRDQLELWSQMYPYASIGIMMALAVVMCICSQADAFVAASFKEVMPASKLAFLVLGPMLDFKLYSMYTRVFKRRLIWTVVACVVIQVYSYALLTHFIWLHIANARAAISPGNG